MKKQFKTESKKMLDMMIHSVYTNKEIFLRELISNASDAIDKRVFRALTEDEKGLDRASYAIVLTADKNARTLTVSDNGCGMTKAELEDNLGTIAHSGSGEFKKENTSDTVDIIGQFGVGFYSAFMVADKVTVRTRSMDEETAWEWVSEGTDGYTISECEKAGIGTEVVLHLREDAEGEDYCEYLDTYRIRSLVRKYSDYIRYPIRTDVEKSRPKEGSDPEKPEYESVMETETLNSMVPLWHKTPADIKKEEYNEYYKAHFYDYADPLHVIHSRTEGTVSFEMLLYVPSKAPMDYYTKNYEKGLQLYTAGVMITEKCAELLPDYFNFVRGVVDSADLTLNISRETLQQDHRVKTMAKSIEKKIRTELSKMCAEKREEYEKFFAEFGLQLKYGAYADYGTNKEALRDLLLFRTSLERKFSTLKEYVSRMPEAQKDIYYACAETVGLADELPRTAAVKAKGYEVMLLTDDIDEFVLRTLDEYEGKKFVNVSTDSLDLETEDEKDAVKKANEADAALLGAMKDALGDEVTAVRFSASLGGHPVNLSSEGYLSAEMAKVLSHMPGAEEAAKAQMVLEINMTHPVAETLRKAFAADADKVAAYAKILYGQARLIAGLGVDDPAALTELICGLL